jgi:glutamate racemase
VVQLGCPLLVPLVEEGWLGDGATDARPSSTLEDRAAEATARRYLGELHAAAPELDVLVLGCTHYPLLRPLLTRVADELWRHGVTLVDSAQAMARAAAGRLADAHLFAPHGGALRCYVTDDARFAEVGSRFLGCPLEQVEKVDLA